MSPGDVTLMKIVSATCDAEEARRQFEIGFPADRQGQIFDSVVRHLIKEGMIKRTKRGAGFELTSKGKEWMQFWLEAEHRNLREN